MAMLRVRDREMICGPLTEEKIRQMLEVRQFGPSCLVSEDGVRWIPILEHPAFGEGRQQPQPAQTPPATVETRPLAHRGNQAVVVVGIVVAVLALAGLWLRLPPPSPPKTMVVLSQDVKIQPAWLYHRGVPFTLPYARNDVSLVLEAKAPPSAAFNACLMDPAEWSKYQGSFMEAELRVYTQFGAEKVSRLSRRGPLPRGDYVLALRGCGVLQEPTVSVRVEATELP